MFLPVPSPRHNVAFMLHFSAPDGTQRDLQLPLILLIHLNTWMHQWQLLPCSALPSSLGQVMIQVSCLHVRTFEAAGLSLVHLLHQLSHRSNNPQNYIVPKRPEYG